MNKYLRYQDLKTDASFLLIPKELPKQVPKQVCLTEAIGRLYKNHETFQFQLFH
jgi:hypothetical protein